MVWNLALRLVLSHVVFFRVVFLHVSLLHLVFLGLVLRKIGKNWGRSCQSTADGDGHQKLLHVFSFRDWCLFDTPRRKRPGAPIRARSGSKVTVRDKFFLGPNVVTMVRCAKREP